ncbi:MAG: FKBP-type peptidyl-prolyl cis-trans isomerase [Bacteroidota bacterium]
MKNVRYLFVLMSLLFLVACGGDVADLTVEEYIEANNLETTELDSGVHISIDRPGNNRKPNINSTVVVNYKGFLTNGNVFDQRSNQEFQLAGLIEGWRIGLKEIGEGGSCTLVIPPGAGYGSSANGTIPANSVLVFEMDLLEVK